MRSFTLEIRTAEKDIFWDRVLSLKLTAVDGELGILPGHAPLATRLAPSPIRFTLQSGEEVKVDGGEGFLIVSNDTASILLKSQRI